MIEMKILLNGKEIHLHEGATLGALLRDHDISEKTDGVAVAVNAAVVPRRQWPNLHLHDGDTIEVIHAVQGG
jgi:sulfur carrier protein